MTLYITNQEAEAIVDACKGMLTKSQASLRKTIIEQIETRQGKREIPDSKRSFVPMRSAWPSNFIKRARKISAKIPRNSTKPKQPTAEEVLASLSL
jgi:hypothetical protein